MNRYLLRHKLEGDSAGEEFLLDAHDMKHAKENANFYNAVVIGKLYEPFGKMKFVKDLSCDWSKHRTD